MIRQVNEREAVSEALLITIPRLQQENKKLLQRIMDLEGENQQLREQIWDMWG